jgi:TolB-like protein/class 3 adenylate cyclase/Tfp pilus assembly protein PilF
MLRRRHLDASERCFGSTEGQRTAIIVGGRGTPVPEQNLSAGDKTDLALEIAHLLFIDVVGYSKLLVNEQIELMQQLNRIVRGTECFRDAEASGKLIRLPTGDGMVLLFFRSPEQPVRCALEISQALRSHSHIQVRMGIHSGPVNQVTDVNDQLNIAGAGINVGQRVMDCADAGHILLSKHIADDLAQYRHWRPHLYDLGECEVKHGVRLHIFNLAKDNLGNSQVPTKFGRGRRWKPVDRSIVRSLKQATWPKPVLAAAVVLSAIALALGGWLLWKWKSGITTELPSVPEKSIAVLPFENRSDDKANGYFADAIQDEILTRLSKIADLKVISRTSTQQYKSTPGNLPTIARQLGVAHVLEGSVQKSAGVVRVNVQLIRAANDSHLWADTFDRQVSDILLVESEIAKTIADQLRAKITGQEEQAISVRATDNSAAYDSYLRGLAYTVKPGNTSASLRNAQNYFREAVRLDPNFALGWALLASSDARGYSSLNFEATTALREEARQAADTALTLQPDLGEARLAEAEYYYGCLRKYDVAVRYLEQASRLLPNSSRIPEVLAYVARRRGEWDRSETYFNEAERLDPRSPSVLTEHAYLYESRRQFQQALQKANQILDVVPDDPATLTLQAQIAHAQGDLARAAALLAGVQPSRADSAIIWAKAYHAVLDRHPRQILPWLARMLSSSEPATTNSDPELRFWLGWLQQMGGDRAAAEQTWRQARDEAESLAKSQPENDVVIGDLALINMALGKKADAISLAERAIAMNPIETDAISGPAGIEVLARVAAQLSEPDRAMAALQKLLAIPYSGPVDVPLTPALLRLDPMFDPLRNDPRFQKLAGSSTPH